MADTDLAGYREVKAASGDPVAGVRVLLKAGGATQQQATSGADGAFAFSNVACGEYAALSRCCWHQSTAALHRRPLAFCSRSLPATTHCCSAAALNAC